MDFLERAFRIILLLIAFYCFLFFLGIEKIGRAYLPDPGGAFIVIITGISLLASLFIPKWKYRGTSVSARRVRNALRRIYLYLFVMLLGILFLFSSHTLWDVSFVFGYIFLFGGFCGLIFFGSKNVYIF